MSTKKLIQMAIDLVFYLITPKPKAGCMFASPTDECLTSAQAGDLPEQPFGGIDGIVDMNNMPTYNQGRTPHCCAYGTIGVIETMLVSKYMDKGIYFDREFYAQKLRDVGIMTDNGAYVHRVVAWFYENGITDSRGNEYKIGKPLEIAMADYFTVMNKGYPVVHGAFWGSPYYDSNYVWNKKTLSTGGGHCTFSHQVFPKGKVELNDGTTNEQYYLGDETSWGSRFGIKKKNSAMSTGTLYVRENDMSGFFTPYIFSSVEKC